MNSIPNLMLLTLYIIKYKTRYNTVDKCPGMPFRGVPHLFWLGLNPI